MESWSAFRLLLQPHHNCQPVKPTVRQLNDKDDDDDNDDERQGHYIIQWPPILALLVIATKFPRPTIMNVKKKAKKATKGYRFYYGHAETHKKVTLGNVPAGGNYSVKGRDQGRQGHTPQPMVVLRTWTAKPIDRFIHLFPVFQSITQSITEQQRCKWCSRCYYNVIEARARAIHVLLG